MTFWAFLLPIVYVPDWTGAVMQSGWAYLCLTIPFFMWNRQANPSPATKWLGLLGVGLVAYSIFSLWLLPRPEFGLERLMQLFGMGISFWFAMSLTAQELGKVIRGLNLGLIVSIVIAVVQHFVDLGLQYNTRPAGLVFSPIILGDACAVLTLLVEEWWLFGVMLFGVALSGSRGAMVAFAVGAICRLGRKHIAFFGLAILPILAIEYWWAHPSESDILRLFVWQNILAHFTWLGHGPGSLDTTILTYQGIPHVVNYGHNEFLDALHSYGVGAILFWIILIWPLAYYSRKEWPAYCAAFTTALWSFPSHSPVEGFLWALLAGYLCSGWHLLRDDRMGRRHSLANRMESPRPVLGSGWWDNSSVESGSRFKEAG